MCIYPHLLCICGSVYHVLPLHPPKTSPTHNRVAHGGDPGLGQITGNPTSMHSRIHSSLLFSATLTYKVARVLMLQAHALNWTEPITDPAPVLLTLSRLG